MFGIVVVWFGAESRETIEVAIEVKRFAYNRTGDKSEMQENQKKS